MSKAHVSTNSPVVQYDNPKLAMWAFLGGEVVFFISLILLIVFTRMVNGNYEADFRSLLSIPLIAVNTFVLLTSSYFVVRSLDRLHGGEAHPKGMRNNLLVVVVLGIAFLGGQAWEWMGLFRDGLSMSSTYGSAFFTVTGIHGTHVLIGLVWAVFLLVGNARRSYTERDYLSVENFGLYWHFVDVVWIALFTIIYLI